MVANFIDAAAELWDRMEPVAGADVTYQPANESITPFAIRALKLRRNTQINASEFVLTEFADDFVFRRQDLIDEGVIPQRLDRILWEDPFGQERLFEVHLPGGGRQYDPSDHNGVLIRVHVKEVPNPA